MKHSLILIAAVTALAACTEKPQTLGSSARQDTPAFQGTGTATFLAPDWKPGDKTSWEQHMKTRTQNQNEYTKVN